MMTSLTADRGNLTTMAYARAAGGEARRLAALIALWRERHSTRQHLARMSPHMLRDIGVTPGDAADEIAKPFWRA